MLPTVTLIHHINKSTLIQPILIAPADNLTLRRGPFTNFTPKEKPPGSSFSVYQLLRGNPAKLLLRNCRRSRPRPAFAPGAQDRQWLLHHFGKRNKRREHGRNQQISRFGAYIERVTKCLSEYGLDARVARQPQR